SFFEAVAYGHRMPQYNWHVLKDGTIVVRTDTVPVTVRLWMAENPEARDFRVGTIGRVWRSEPIAEHRLGEYRGKVLPPEVGWRAYFIELTFEGPGEAKHIVTSEVKVLPEVYPFEYT